MTTDEIKAEIQHLERQHPSPWTEGAWYPATNRAGKLMEIRRTRGRGRLAGKRYLHARILAHQVIVHPDGTREQTGRITYLYYRMDLTSYTVEAL